MLFTTAWLRPKRTCEDEEAAAFVQTAPPLPPFSLLQGTAQRNAVTKRRAARTDNRKLSTWEGQINAVFSSWWLNFPNVYKIVPQSSMIPHLAIIFMKTYHNSDELSK